VGAARSAAAENSVKVYSYKWEPTDPTGINSVDNSQSAIGSEAGAWYTIDGRKLSGKPAQKGIYIVNGRKVAVK
jgi:alpha-amylase